MSVVERFPFEATYLDHGFYLISKKTAKGLCDGKLPKAGYEKLVEVNGTHYWIARTMHLDTLVWSIRDSGGWTLKDGHMVLE